jgi:acetoin utilization deacetylase AcuC-like enzyme
VKPKVGVVFDEEMMLHKCYKAYHPERPERIMSIYLNLINKGIYEDLIKLECELAEDSDLKLVHPLAHIQKIKDINLSKTESKSEKKEIYELGPKKNTRRFQKDTYENIHTVNAAYLAAGGTIEGMRAVCNKSVTSSFCIVRPPGHHA